jgi:sigma-B regulation protein RsbU (phosphoserine phosphatase)
VSSFRTIRVLLVEDDEDDYVVARDLLDEAGPGVFHLDWVTSAERALEAIAREEHDVYLFDYRIGALTGIELLRELRHRGVHLPVILLTGLLDYDLDLEAMEAGAADYLVKGQITSALLERSIRYAIRHHHDLHARLESERALADARAYEAHIGAHIQGAILFGRLPRQISGARVETLVIPSQTIDGDFYGFFEYADQRFDLVVGDVMGKGIPAALLGAAAKLEFLRAVSQLVLSTQGQPPPPEDLVNVVHASLTPHLQSVGSFLTLVLARLDLPRRLLTLVDCGHTRSLHGCPATGAVTQLQGYNLPLGVDTGEIYRQVSVPFAPGDRFLFYSDGVTDARSPAGEAFGLERLTALFSGLLAANPKNIIVSVQPSPRV